MEITIDTLVAAIGLVGAPALAVMVVDHLKQFTRAVWNAITFLRTGFAAEDRGTPWLLVRDLVLIGAAFLIRDSGGLAPVFDRGIADTPATLILVGLALSLAAGQLYDRGVVRTTSTPRPVESSR